VLGAHRYGATGEEERNQCVHELRRGLGALYIGSESGEGRRSSVGER
jgi:hypothetical protein